MNFQVGEYIDATKKGHGSFVVLPLNLALCISSIWLFLSSSLCNQPVIVKHFPEFGESFRQIIKLE